MRTHLGVDVVDARDGLLDFPLLHGGADVHAVGNRVEVDTGCRG